MTDVTVRPSRADELAEAGELVVRAYAAGGFLNRDDGYADQLRDAAQRSEHAEVLVAVDGADTLLGSVTVVHPGSRYAELSRPGELEFRMLAVDPAARGRGVGEALVRAVLDRATAAGAARVVLCSLKDMSAAHRLYARLGFVRLPELDWWPLPDTPLIAFGVDL